MKIMMKASALTALLLALAVPQMSFADPTSGCVQGPIVDDGDGGSVYGTGDFYGTFTCNLYPSASSYTIDLTPYLTDGGSHNLYDGFIVNPLTPGYEVIINGDPSALADNSVDGVPTGGSGLFDQSLWAAVLYWTGDTNYGTGSDEVTVFYAGVSDFPSATTVDGFDYDAFGGSEDSKFFVESGDPAVYDPGAGDDVYNVYPTPEPSSLFLLGTGLFGLAVVVLRKAKASGLVLHS
jgi:hypothetical protein